MPGVPTTTPPRPTGVLPTSPLSASGGPGGTDVTSPTGFVGTDAKYDMIGHTYGVTRMAEPRLVGEMRRLILVDPPARVADIGAGTGNYTSAFAALGFQMAAVEPSLVMRNGAEVAGNVGAIEWLQGTAEQIPLGDGSVDAVVSTMAVHHFSDPPAAFREMRRIVRDGGALVIQMHDFRLNRARWMPKYFPGFFEERSATQPALEPLLEALRLATGWPVGSEVFLMPRDFQDASILAMWGRPQLFLDFTHQQNSSTLRDLASSRPREMEHLRADLESGQFERDYADLLSQESCDVGFRILFAHSVEG